MLDKLIYELAVRRLFSPKKAERIINGERHFLREGDKDAIQKETEFLRKEHQIPDEDGSVCIDQHIEPEDLKD